MLSALVGGFENDIKSGESCVEFLRGGGARRAVDGDPDEVPGRGRGLGGLVLVSFIEDVRDTKPSFYFLVKLDLETHLIRF